MPNHPARRWASARLEPDPAGGTPSPPSPLPREKGARLVALAALAVTAGLASLLAGCSGYEVLLTPTKVKVTPGFLITSPGEAVDYTLTLYTLVGIPVPSGDITAGWNVFADPLPAEITPPAGERDPGVPGVIDNLGRFEASPVVSPGTYRSGRIRAQVISTFGVYTSAVYVAVDGNISLDAPYADVYPKDLIVPPGAEVPFVPLQIERQSRRVANSQNVSWSVLLGPGTIDPDTGVYAAPAAGPPSDADRDVQVDAAFESGRRVAANLTLDTNPAGPLAALGLVPNTRLKVGLGRRQVFMVFGVDRDGRYIQVTDADWFVEPDIGTVTPRGDGTAEFIAQAAGEGVVSAVRTNLEARQAIVAVIPGA